MNKNDGLHNRQTAQEVNAEYETLLARADYDEADAIAELGHALVPWICAIGIVGVVVAILLRGA